MAESHKKTPRLIVAKRETPKLSLILVLAAIAAMMVLGTWAYSVMPV